MLQEATASFTPSTRSSTLSTFKTIYIRREDMLLCRTALKERRPIRPTDFTAPDAPVAVAGLVKWIEEDPHKLLPIRWEVTLEIPTPKPSAGKRPSAAVRPSEWVGVGNRQPHHSFNLAVTGQFRTPLDVRRSPTHTSGVRGGSRLQ